MSVPDPSPIFQIERPDSKLMTYYFVVCLLTGPLFPILILPNYFRYHTMRYRFDEEGISMRWGILFRREVVLNYARIQDIHLSSNIVERWLGLARIQIQTASGSAAAEMTIEGLLEFNAIRDFLYSKMRGQKTTSGPAVAAIAPSTSGAGSVPLAAADLGELTASLRETAAELRRLREVLTTHKPPPPGVP